MHRGYIKLWRKMEDWEWFDCGHTFKVFCWLMMRATHKDESYQGFEVLRGQMVFGLHKACKATGLTPQVMRSCIKRLKSTNEVTIKSTNQFSIITIVNYTTYQSTENEINKQINKQTNKRITNGQQTDNNIQECKEVKNEKNNTTAKCNPLFWEFKKIYPNFLAFKKTQTLFEKLKVTPELWAEMSSAIARQKESRQWREGFIPASFNWLEDERWKDEIAEKPEDKLQQLRERLKKR